MAEQLTDNSPIQVVLEVPGRESLQSVLTSVSGADAPAKTKEIGPATPSKESSVTVELGDLTTKQLETLQLAIEEGYYRRPREATLQDLAALLEISKSAVSQRIRTAERTLIKSALQRYE